MKYLIKGKCLFPVCTYVEAETDEEALRIAKERYVGLDANTEWALDESQFPNRKLN